MRKIIYLFTLLSTLLFVSCNEKLIEAKLTGCYFQYEYLNYAWVYQHSGFTITPAGEVYTFDKTTPWAFADNDKLTLAALRKNMEASIKKDTLINSTDIEHFRQLTSNALSGKPSELVSSGSADVGERICKIIVADASDPLNTYREIILSEDGDFERHNLSPEAAVIAEWLNKFRFH